MADKTIGEVTSDSNEENIELDEQARSTDIQQQKYKQTPFPMIQGTSKHTSALKEVSEEKEEKKKFGEMSGKEKLKVVGDAMAKTWG